jgi:hypothetical protein
MVERLITIERAGSVRCSVHLVPWGKNKPNSSAVHRMKFRFRTRFLIALIAALLLQNPSLVVAPLYPKIHLATKVFYGRYFGFSTFIPARKRRAGGRCFSKKSLPR